MAFRVLSIPTWVRDLLAPQARRPRRFVPNALGCEARNLTSDIAFPTADVGDAPANPDATDPGATDPDATDPTTPAAAPADGSGNPPTTGDPGSSGGSSGTPVPVLLGTVSWG